MDVLKVPSGRNFYASDLELMRGAAEVDFVKWHKEKQDLVSGGKTHVYVLGRDDATENPLFLRLACRKILNDTSMLFDMHHVMQRPRFIGVPHVAHGWTPAITMVDVYEGITRKKACHLIMRSAPKSHGARKNKWVEGEYNPAAFCDVLFDNALTAASSIETAAKNMVTDGWRLSTVFGMVFVDRQQGGFRKMETLGFRSTWANYLLLDMAFAFQHLGLWPSDATERVEREIRENQITA